MNRIKALQKEMVSKGKTALLIENPIDIFYLTGVSLSLGKLLVTREKASLFVDGRYLGAAKQKVPELACCLTKARAALQEEKEIAFDSSWTTVEALRAWEKEVSGTVWTPWAAPLELLRAKKSPEEVEALRKAALLTRAGIAHVHSLFQEGISERELALEFEIFCKKKGASALSFETIIAFGPNSAHPHHRAGESRLRKGDLVLVDAGALLEGYTGDLTRVFFFGPPHPKLQELCKIVQEAQRRAIEKVAPGIRAGELDEIVRAFFDQHNVKPLYMHSLGHGVGVEVHEFPRLSFSGRDKDVRLEEGFCFTIEPGLYLEGVGGIRLEEMVHVTSKGAEVLSC